jgi:hypothetical protein
VRIGEIQKTSKDAVDALFDTKLSRSQHIRNSNTKAYKALNAIKLLKKYFSSKELVLLLKGNNYSILFYNNEVWHLNNLKLLQKH